MPDIEIPALAEGDPNAEPAEGEPITADRLARVLTRRAIGNRAAIDAMILRGQVGGDFPQTFTAYHAQFAAAFTLRELAHYDPARADVVAQSIWEAWQHAEVGEWVWDWADEYGIPTGPVL